MKVGDLVRPKIFHELAQEEYGLGLIMSYNGMLRGMKTYTLFFAKNNKKMDFYEGELLTVNRGDK